MKDIYYEKNDELCFNLGNSGYAAYVYYKKSVKDNKNGFEISIWIGDSSDYGAGYKKYIHDDFLTAINFNEAKKAIKTKISLMFSNGTFDSYIKNYEKEINCIGEMYLQEEEVKKLN